MSIPKNVSLICLQRTICTNNGFTNHKKLIVDYPLLVLNLAVNIPDMVLPLKSCFSRSDLANFSNFVLHFVSTCWGASLALNQTSNRNTNFYPESYWVQLRLILALLKFIVASVQSCIFIFTGAILPPLYFDQLIFVFRDIQHWKKRQTVEKLPSPYAKTRKNWGWLFKSIFILIS